jgi:hypothetical protein
VLRDQYAAEYEDFVQKHPDIASTPDLEDAENAYTANAQ